MRFAITILASSAVPCPEPFSEGYWLARAGRWRASIPIGCCSASLARSSERGRGCDGEFAGWQKPARYAPASNGAIDARERRWPASARDPEDAQFHTWRRRVKDHWYHMRLLDGFNPHSQIRMRRLKQLETWLGDDHDLVVLRATILEAPARFGDERMTAVVLGCMAKYQTTLRRRALKRGDQLFASTPTAFSAQIDR